jgi:Cytokine-induced anti-apoptosis inhibitor 1, Fe-S biogenesis
MTADSSNKATVYLGSASPSDSADRTAESLSKASQALAGASSAFDSIVLVVKSADLESSYNPMDLAALCNHLSSASDSSISVQVLEAGSASSAQLQRIHNSFLLAGLIGVSERIDADGKRVFTAARRKVVVTAEPLNRNTVTLTDNDLIDEDDLLTDISNQGLLAPPSMEAKASKNADDCGGREPCDDCTCGRSSEKAASVSQPKTVPKSSCGKCGLGDAFRCPTCPYLGKPAFKPGEEHLVLDLQDDL